MSKLQREYERLYSEHLAINQKADQVRAGKATPKKFRRRQAQYDHECAALESSFSPSTKRLVGWCILGAAVMAILIEMFT